MKFLNLFLMAVVLCCVAFVSANDADAGIFGRGRGIFRGAWGSRNAGGCSAGSCGTACGTSACGPAGCSPAKAPAKAAAANAPLAPQ